MHIVTRIRIGNQRNFLGKGVKELLDAVDMYKSIKKASQITGISYPKALRMLKIFEEEMGFSAVISEKGGSSYGGTVLSEKGKEVLESYKIIEKKVEDFAEDLLLKSDVFNTK